MTEIAQVQGNGLAAFSPQPDPMAGVPSAPQGSAVNTLEGWAQELDAAFRLSQMVCQTAFAPQHFRGKPEEAATAMLYGHTIGLPPMVAIKSIYVVHGTPAIYAKTMYAIALAAGHQIERVHATEQSVKFRCRRKGSQQWQDVEWTIERARQAGYTTNKQYQSNPIGMLGAKCMAEAANLVAADALAGMASVEEVQLGDVDGAVPGVEDTPAPAPSESKRTVKRKPRGKAPEPQAPDLPPAPEPEPEGEDEAAEVEDTPVMSDRAQWVQAGQLMSDLGIEEKSDKAREMREWATSQGITRDLPSMAALTSDECAAFTDYLQSLTTGQLAGPEDPEDAS